MVSSELWDAKRIGAGSALAGRGGLVLQAGPGS